jgi:D-alanyl-D-alanine carboxypeptidase (penicillin-binding protein 5/6)
VGSDLLFSAVVPVGTPQPLTIIGVVLGGSTHESVDLDVQAMIASVQAGFHNVDVGAAGQVVGHYSTPWGGAADMVLADSASVFTWSNTPITSTMTTWTAGKNAITVPIVLKGSIKPPTTKWRLTHPKQLLSWWP